MAKRKGADIGREREWTRSALMKSRVCIHVRQRCGRTTRDRHGIQRGRTHTREKPSRERPLARKTSVPDARYDFCASRKRDQRLCACQYSPRHAGKRRRDEIFFGINRSRHRTLHFLFIFVVLPNFRKFYFNLCYAKSAIIIFTLRQHTFYSSGDSNILVPPFLFLAMRAIPLFPQTPLNFLSAIINRAPPVR